MDPLGFALENFNAVGDPRQRPDTLTPIDTAGQLPDGTTIKGLTICAGRWSIGPIISSCRRSPRT